MDPQNLFDLAHQLKGIPGLPVHFVHKGKDRDMAHHTDLEKLDGLRLHTLGAVDDHHRRIRSHKGPVGILREVLMARRVQDIDAVAFIIKL